MDLVVRARAEVKLKVNASRSSASRTPTVKMARASADRAPGMSQRSVGPIDHASAILSARRSACVFKTSSASRVITTSALAARRACRGVQRTVSVLSVSLTHTACHPKRVSTAGVLSLEIVNRTRSALGAAHVWATSACWQTAPETDSTMEMRPC